ncbi:MAG: hypothetical protein E6772_01620 [Dysgonomonas sp.]|nr:hypothetical protein [Dysgonomonas sp.]
MKKCIKNLTVVFFILFFGLTFMQCTDKTQKFVENLVADANKDNPRMMDKFIRLENCEALPGHTMRYNYTLLFSTSEEVDSIEFKKNMTPYLIYNLQRSGEISNVLRDMDVTFIHSYKNEDGKQIGYIVLNPEDYKKEVVDVQHPMSSHGSDFLEKDNLEESLRTIAASMQPKLPLNMKEQNLIITDCRLYKDNVLGYTYKLTDQSVANFDSVQYKQTAYTNAVQTLKNAPIMKKMADNGAHIRYVYLDKDENYLCRIELSSDDLK